jgi:hypothetical protein
MTRRNRSHPHNVTLGGDIMLAEWHDEGDGIWKEEQSTSAPRRMTEGARSGQCLELAEADMQL